jgi:hypothetical protein
MRKTTIEKKRTIQTKQPGPVFFGGSVAVGLWAAPLLELSSKGLLSDFMPLKNSNFPGKMRPNVLVTGTPGTGKTTLSELLCQQSGYRHINISEVVKEKKLFSSFDEVMQAYEIDDDKVSPLHRPSPRRSATR